MSLGTRSPRKSAIGLDFVEDFSRGRLGCVKNGGDIVEAAPNFVNFRGPWCEFPGSVAAHIDYPHHIVTGHTEITVGCWIDAVVSTGNPQAMVSQFDPGAIPGTLEFAIYLLADGSPIFILNISNVARTATIGVPLFGLKVFLVGTWSSGDFLRLYGQGVQVATSAAAYAGVLIDSNQPLCISRCNGGSFPFLGRISEPFVDFRAWDAATVLAYYNRSLFN